jgi:hypothetical protein
MPTVACMQCGVGQVRWLSCERLGASFEKRNISSQGEMFCIGILLDTRHIAEHAFYNSHCPCLHILAWVWRLSYGMLPGPGNTEDTFM